MNSEQQGKLEAAQSGSQLSPFPAAHSHIGALAQSMCAEGAAHGMAQPCPAWEWGPLLAAAGQPWWWAGCCALGNFIITRSLAMQVLSLLCRLGEEFVNDLFCAVIGSDCWSAKSRKAEWSSLQMAGRKWVRFLECC